MKNIFKLLLSGLLFASCGDVEPTIFNGETGNPTFLSFSRTSYLLPIERDGAGTLTVTLNSSTLSDVARTYNIEIDQELSTADPLTYSIPSTVTIPAGSYQGNLVITGQDLDLVESAVKPVYIKISNLTNESFDANQAIINVGEVCSVFAPFVGTYKITQLTEPIPLNGGITVFANGLEVDLTIPEDGTDFDRTFSAVIYPTVLSTPQNFNFRLVCGNTFFTDEIDTGAACSADTPNLTFAPADTGFESTYDPEDDSIIDITVTENASGACGGAPIQTTIRLTKVQ